MKISELKLLEYKIVEIVQNTSRCLVVDYWDQQVREVTLAQRESTGKLISARIMRYSFDYLTATDNW